ncbi:hypothetical protein KAT95_00915 [Candidatus Parcubacteria bacterium]|nr:hypothetical protein [Candidatus Parcubacteria bacterium]
MVDFEKRKEIVERLRFYEEGIVYLMDRPQYYRFIRYKLRNALSTRKEELEKTIKKFNISKHREETLIELLEELVDLAMIEKIDLIIGNNKNIERKVKKILNTTISYIRNMKGVRINLKNEFGINVDDYFEKFFRNCQNTFEMISIKPKIEVLTERIENEKLLPEIDKDEVLNQIAKIETKSQLEKFRRIMEERMGIIVKVF